MSTAFYQSAASYLRLGMKVGANFDAVEKIISYHRRRARLFLLTTLTSSVEIIAIAESLIQSPRASDTAEQLYSGSISKVYRYQDLLRLALAGVAILLLPNEEFAYAIETRSYPTRSISEPSTEKSIRGSKDGFTESINDDIGLIRRRVRSKEFKVTLYRIGAESKTDVALVYLEDKADPAMIEELDRRLKAIKVESLVMTDRALEEKLFPQKLSPFPLARYTERPDIASINLYQGKALLVVDTSASVVITPTTWADHTKNVEEYRQSPLVGSFTRLLRTAAILLSVFLIPLWLALVTETSVNNFFVIHPSKEVDMPIILQVLIAELFIEFIRLAVVHTPSELTSSIGVVAAIILGSVSIELEIFLPEILVYVSFAAIASFATPSYELSLANRLTKYFLILLSYFFGRAGFVLGSLALFCYLASLKVFTVPYLFPLVPFDVRRAGKLVYREDASEKDVL